MNCSRQKGNLLGHDEPIVDLGDPLEGIVERTITDDKAVATCREIPSVRGRDSVHGERHAEVVVLAIPRRSGLRNSQGERSVDLGERPGLILAVVPAQAEERAERISQLLIGAEREAGLRRP